MPPDSKRLCPTPRRSWLPLRAVGSLLCTSLLVACSTLPSPAPEAPPVPPARLPAAQPGQTQTSPPTPQALAEPATTPTPSTTIVRPEPPPTRRDPLDTVLGYADRLRTLAPSELLAEQLALGDPAHTPVRQMQQALLWMQAPQNADHQRALILLQRVLGSNAEDAVALRPLARLLATRLQETRRLEDLNDRQAQQLREAQRRIDLLTDRLEAMRAIERSLSPRSPPPGNRPPPP